MPTCDTCGEVKTCQKLCPDMEKLLKKETVSDRREFVLKVDPSYMDNLLYRRKMRGSRKKPIIYNDNWEL